MSMAVDLNTPLTDEERDYLHMRGRLSDIERADALHGEASDRQYLGDGTGPVTTPLGTAEQQINRREQLLAELAAMGLDVEVKEAEPDDGTEDETAPPYETWSSKDINTEIDRRNVDRAEGDKISKAGSVSERADRLYMDDERQV